MLTMLQFEQTPDDSNINDISLQMVDRVIPYGGGTLAWMENQSESMQCNLKQTFLHEKGSAG